jgi:23S rRNA pseudouridine2605 synthase
MAEQRLAKILAARGLCSRREAEEWIREGRVSVNGEVPTHPGTPADPERDHIKVDGHRLPEPPPMVYFLLNKPRGYITSRKDPEGRKNVLQLASDIPYRVEPVGRLDLDTEGALLLTNDGDLAHKLTHPSSRISKRYVVKVWKRPSDRSLERIQRGMRLEDGPSQPCKIRIVDQTDTGNTWLEVTVTEGKNRLVRRLFDAVGHPVSKLRRESFATISCRDLERGELRPLSRDEVRRLQALAEGKNPSKKRGRTQRKKGYAMPRPKGGRKSRKNLARSRRAR